MSLIAPSRRRRGTWLLVIAAGLAALYAVLATFLELPLERSLKGLVGIDYDACGQLRHQGKPGPWRAETPLPHVRDEAAAAAAGRSIYIVGGLYAFPGPNSSRSTDSLIRYDTRTRRYQVLPRAPAKLHHPALAAYRGNLYMVGGAVDPFATWRATGRAWRYSIAERRWHRLPPMPTARGALGLAVAGGRLYAVGGSPPHSNEEGGLRTVEVLNPRIDRWSTAAPLHVARLHLGVAASGGRIYAVGGRQNTYGPVLGTFERYDPRRNSWTRLPNLPEPTSAMTMSDVAGHLVTVGGEEPGRWVTGSAWSYDPARESWARLPSIPTPRHGNVSAAVGDRFYVFGGSTCNGWHPSRLAYSLRVARAR